MQRKSDYSSEMIAFLQAHYPVAPVSDWVDEFNRTFGTKKSKSALIGTCKRYSIKSGRTGLFVKGQAAHNKGKSMPMRGKTAETAFGGCRGNRPDNSKPIGSTRICPKDGYLIVKVAEPSTWRLGHVVLWEKHNGPVPKGHVIRFYDNSLDKRGKPTIDNLFMVSRQVHSRLTQMKLSEFPMEHKETLILIAKIEQQIKDKESN